ncbi:MAG TPA: hypothetical protein PKI86_07365 [Chitinophagales bacterium]|nr:hypothetical protein [Chitinophagales bacterium]
MNLNERKLEIIEEILHLEDENTISLLENTLRKSTEKPKSLAYYAGILTSKEANNMRKIIEEDCETINKDDWK